MYAASIRQGHKKCFAGLFGRDSEKTHLSLEILDQKTFENTVHFFLTDVENISEGTTACSVSKPGPLWGRIRS